MQGQGGDGRRKGLTTAMAAAAWPPARRRELQKWETFSFSLKQQRTVLLWTIMNHCQAVTM